VMWLPADRALSFPLLLPAALADPGHE